MDRTEPDRFGPTRCGPVDDVIIGSRTCKKILLTALTRLCYSSAVRPLRLQPPAQALHWCW